LIDPSLPERELERQVPRNHPVALKVDAILKRLVERFGGPVPEPPAAAQQPAAPKPALPKPATPRPAPPAAGNQ
jgi:hypothetical protein